MLLQVEVTTDDSFESFGRISEVLDHREFNVTVSHDIRVSFVLFLTFGCALLVFETWLIEIYFFTHDDCLDGKEDLKKS